MQECSLKNFISIDQCVQLLDWPKLFGNDNPIDVEIGFGTGEHLIQLGRENPQRNFIGIEQDRKRLLKTARKITLYEQAEGDALKNIKLLGIDAWIVFERLLNESSIDNIYCLFPCPWPKKKHVKFRLFNQRFLQLLNSRLKDGGRVKMVTDSFPFYSWVQEEVVDSGFLTKREVIDPQFNTKFEKKWCEQGQDQFFQLELKKEDSQRVPLKKENPLKAYKIKDFNPRNFQFSNLEGETSIIFKEMVFDEEKKKAMLLFVVSEPNLMQSFWVSIAYKKDEWIIGRALGQNLLQTQGLAMTLEKVHSAALESING